MSWINNLRIDELEELARTLNAKVKDKERSTKTGLPVSRTDRLRKAIGKKLKKYPEYSNLLKERLYKDNQGSIDIDKSILEKIQNSEIIDEGLLRKEKEKEPTTPVDRLSSPEFISEFANNIKQDHKKKENQEYIDRNPSFPTSTPLKEGTLNPRIEINRILDEIAGKTTPNLAQERLSRENFRENPKMAHNKIKITTIPKFSGEEDVTRFLNLVELSAKVGEYTEQEKEILFLNSLKEKALDYYMELQEEDAPIKWEKIKSKFKKKFKKDDAVIIRNITSSKQNEEESPLEYFKRVIKMKKQLENDIDEKTILISIKMGLRPNIREKITLHDNSTLKKMEENLEILKRDKEMEEDFSSAKNRELELKIAKLELESAKKKLEEVEKEKESINAIGRSKDFHQGENGYSERKYEGYPKKQYGGYPGDNYYGYHRGNYNVYPRDNFNGYSRGNYSGPQNGYRENWGPPSTYQGRYMRNSYTKQGRGRRFDKKCENCPHLSNHLTKECFKTKPAIRDTKNE